MLREKLITAPQKSRRVAVKKMPAIAR